MVNNKKLIDLGILSEDEQSGVKRVSIVEEPAIELDFRYFGKQHEFVKPSAGESQDEFVSRCIPVILKEGKPIDQAAAICYSSWEQRFAVGMPHYTEDGVLYEGPTHKDADGRLMTGATHTEDSEYLYHEDEFAEIGPRGGIKKSPKAPKGDTPNKNPKGEGTSKGSAKDTRNAEVSKQAEASLQKKSDDFNEKHKDKLGYGTTIGQLKAVYQRGKGAYNSSHSPNVSSAEQWAQARVNAYLYLVKNGRPQNKNYKQDNDLLPAKHPKAGEKMSSIDVTINCDECNHSWNILDGGDDVYICHNCGHDNEIKTMIFESYNDYPESAKNAAKRALDFRDANPDTDCGTPVGWARANQLAKGENISEETIARMASFARHLQYKDVPYTEGCGGLMVDAWGGQAGIEWASNKLEEIRTEMDIDTSGLAPYVDPGDKKQKLVTKAILAEKETVVDYSWTKDEYVVETIIALAKELGIKETDIKGLFKQKFTSANQDGIGQDNIPGQMLSEGKDSLRLYKYEGRIRSNSRDFCRQMVDLDLFYTEDSIKAMSDVAYNPGFGRDGAATYSIWNFKGGPNCYHSFFKYEAYTKKNGDIMLRRIGPVAGRAGTRPINMPKQGYYNKVAFKFASEDQMILVGPVMVPNVSIPRIDEDGEKYFVRFSPETIKEICMKYMKEGRTNDVNTDHEENSAGAYIYESWIVESEDDKANTVYDYNVPVGTWMIAMKVDDKKTWERIKAGALRGFSIEGILMDLEELEAKKAYERIKKILS